MRFSAGHQQRRFRRDGHHSILPLILDPTKSLHNLCRAAQTIRIYSASAAFVVRARINLFAELRKVSGIFLFSLSFFKSVGVNRTSNRSEISSGVFGLFERFLTIM